jgi:hypothetical protein
MTKDTEQRAFTSWKLDQLDAMSVDTDLTDAEFRVAFRLMQHVNSASRIAWPSIERLAAQLGRSTDAVKAAMKGLWGTERPWVKKTRPHKRASNQYSFLPDRINLVLDARDKRMDDLENDKFEVANSHPQTPVEVANPPGSEVANPPSLEVADLPPKHLIGTTLEEHLNFKGSEDRELGAYARAKMRTA